MLLVPKFWNNSPKRKSHLTILRKTWNSLLVPSNFSGTTATVFCDRLVGTVANALTVRKVYLEFPARIKNNAYARRLSGVECVQCGVCYSHY